MAWKSVQEQIKMARAKVGMTQAELAEACGFNGQAAVARLESGRHEVRVDTLRRIADVTGFTFTIRPKPEQ